MSAPLRTAPSPRARRARGVGAEAGPRVCAWCHGLLADDADAEDFGGAELHRPCADEFALWANEDERGAPAGDARDPDDARGCLRPASLR